MSKPKQQSTDQAPQTRDRYNYTHVIEARNHGFRVRVMRDRRDGNGEREIHSSSEPLPSHAEAEDYAQRYIQAENERQARWERIRRERQAALPDTLIEVQQKIDDAQGKLSDANRRVADLKKEITDHTNRITALIREANDPDVQLVFSWTSDASNPSANDTAANSKPKVAEPKPVESKPADTSKATDKSKAKGRDKPKAPPRAPQTNTAVPVFPLASLVEHKDDGRRGRVTAYKGKMVTVVWEGGEKATLKASSLKPAKERSATKRLGLDPSKVDFDSTTPAA